VTLLATRVRKARYPSLCSLCGAPVLVGQHVGFLPQLDGWSHVACIAERLTGQHSCP